MKSACDPKRPGPILAMISCMVAAILSTACGIATPGNGALPEYTDGSHGSNRDVLYVASRENEVMDESRSRSDTDARSKELIEGIRELSRKIEELNTQKSATKGFLATLIALQPLLAGVLIAGVGTIATIIYNNHQLQLVQLNALDKYRTYLASTDPQEREFGYQAFLALGQESFVAKLIGIKKDPAGEDVLITITEQSKDPAARAVARQSLLSLPQERRIRAIVNIFETGKVESDYRAVTRIPGQTILTYGSGGSSLGSGDLSTLIQSYVEAPDGRFGNALSPYLARLQSRDGLLANEQNFLDALRQAGADPVMQRLQDDLFKQKFFDPAYALARKEGIATALGVAVVYDSIVQGAWMRLRDEVNTREGTLQALGEKKWVAAYVKHRREWLATKPNPLRTLVYRMDAFLALIAAGNWDLLPPLDIRGVIIDDSKLESSTSAKTQ